MAERAIPIRHVLPELAAPLPLNHERRAKKLNKRLLKKCFSPPEVPGAKSSHKKVSLLSSNLGIEIENRFINSGKQLPLKKKWRILISAEKSFSLT